MAKKVEGPNGNTATSGTSSKNVGKNVSGKIGPSNLQLQRLLHRHLDKPLAELADIAISWRVTPLRLLMLVNNPFWSDILVERLREPLQELAKRHDRTLHVIGGSVTNTTAITDQQTFQTFFNDPGNEFAIATCRNAAQAPGVSHNPIYISGPAGTGKTHLIRATAGLLRKPR